MAETITSVVATPPVPAATSTNPRVYNAIYSSVQVYECMVRGIAVMRRRLDSYVNATQILKVAGIDKGRRTKILEKEILPGRHEIVQGGYGKYQGTWIPLERGREVATQFGVLPLLAPLFDYVPTPNSVGNLSTARQPQHALFGFQHTAYPAPYSHLGHPYVPPGTAMTMLQQGRANGLFTPSQASVTTPSAGTQPTIPDASTSPAVSTLKATTSLQAPAGSAQEAQPPSLPQSTQPATGDSLSATQAGMKRQRPGSAQGHPAPQPSSTASTSVFDSKIVSGNNQKQSLQEGATMEVSNTIDAPAPLDVPRSGGDRAAKRPRLSPPPSHSRPTPPEIEPLAGTDDNVAQPHHQSGVPSSPSQINIHPQPSRQPSTLSTSTSFTMGSLSQASTHVPPPPSVNKHKVDLPQSLTRLSSKAPTSRSMDDDRQAPLKSAATRAILLAMFHDEDPATVLDMLNAAPASDINMVLDDQGHTALHWAASLARLPLVERLITGGADLHRGNMSGETPLMRAALSTNNHEHQSFSDLVAALHPSLRTVDSSLRTVLHHIAHVAGVKGRAASARYYMETILERLARHKKDQGGFLDLVDLQDVHGDTALNISARVGNRALVRMLMDVGANRTLANKLGLRPGDFGVEGENFKATVAEDYLGMLRKGPSPPVQKSQDVIADMTAMIQSLSSDFQSEIKVKQDALDVTQAHLRAATRELAEQRRQTQYWQTTLAQLDQLQQRIRNVERVLKEEDEFDWTGRTEINGTPSDTSRQGGVPKMFTYKGPASTTNGLEIASATMPPTLDVDPAVPSSPAGDNASTWIRLKKMKAWHARLEDLMSSRIEGSKGASAEKEFQCRKVVSLCTDVPIDQVDAMLENLIIAIESDGQVVDLGRVAGFMQKVSDGASY